MAFLRVIQIGSTELALLIALWVSPAQGQEFCGTCPTGYMWMGPEFDQPEFCSKCDPGYAVGFYGDDFYCASCPSGFAIAPSGEDFFCVPTGGGQSVAVLWAKPYWSKVVWEKPPPGSPCPAGMFGWTGETPGQQPLIDAVYVTKAYSTRSAGSGGAEYNSAVATINVDPASTKWVAWNSTPELTDRGGARRLWGGGGFGTDDFIRVTVTAPDGRSSSVDMDLNDAFGAHKGSDPMNVIFGRRNDAPDALRIDAFGPTAGKNWIYDEDGAFNDLFTTAGTYEIRFSFRNTAGTDAGHSDIWLLKGS